jgi:photosystem II stability/assembly factor-like uncharacterized protein
MKPLRFFFGLVCLFILHVTTAYAQTGWEKLNIPTTENILRIAFNSSGHIFVSTRSGSIFRSTDDGLNWTRLTTGIESTETIATLIVTPTGAILAGTYSGNIFRSTDNGNTWVKILTMWDSVRHLAVTPTGVIFAAWDYGMVRSTDDGVSWESVDDLDGIFVTFIKAGPGTNIFACTYRDGLFRSTDNGDSWELIANIPKNIIESVAITDNGNIYVASQPALLRSADGGNTWDTMAGVQPLIFHLTTTASGDLFVGTIDHGLYHTADYGNSWENLGFGTVYGLATDSNDIIYAAADNDLYRSAHWSHVQIPVNLPRITAMAGTTRTIDLTVGILTQLLPVFSYQFNLTYDTTVMRMIGYSMAGTITAIATAPIVVFEPGVVHCAVASDSSLSGSGPLIRFMADIVAPGTTALTLTGFQFNEGSPSAIITNGQVTVPSFCVSLPNDSLRVSSNNPPSYNIPIYADGISGKGIHSYQFIIAYDTSLIAITGVNATGTSSEPLVGNIIVNTSVAGRISVAAASSDTLSLSGADGATLINLTGQVKPNAHGASALTFVNFQFNEGEPAVGAIDGSAYIEEVCSCWAIRVIERVPSQYMLGQNYPNPFNPTTAIIFGLPEETNVTLTVYNILGLQVRTLLANHKMNAATYSVDWDGKDDNGLRVSSGIYFYRFEAGNFVQTKKMILMK